MARASDAHTSEQVQNISDGPTRSGSTLGLTAEYCSADLARRAAWRHRRCVIVPGVRDIRPRLTPYCGPERTWTHPAHLDAPGRTWTDRGTRFLPPRRLRLVPQTLGEPTPAQAQGWAAIRRAPPHADCGADRIGQDARGVPHRARRAVSRRSRAVRARRSARRLRLAAQGAERRHPQEPGRAAPRHPPGWPRRWASTPPRITAAVRTGDTTADRARGDAPHAAAHPGDDARVAVPAAHGRAQPRHAAHGRARSSSTRSTR